MKNLVKSRFHSFQQPIVIVIAVAVLVWMSGCKPTTSPSTTGSFAGTVVLIDSTRLILPEFLGTTISVDGSSLSTTTDSSGNWKIIGVTEGVYNLTASNLGFGTFHWYEQEIVGGQLNLPVAGIARMHASPPILEAAEFSGLTLELSILPTDSDTQIAEYCDIDSNVQPSDAHLATCFVDLSYFNYDALRTAGAKPGQTLYISSSTIYDDENYPLGFANTFFDPVHNETRWASTGPKSNVIAVTMP